MAEPGMSPAYIADPGLYAQQLQAQQRQQIAALLMQQGMAPMSGTDSVGGVAIRKSPLEGVAKLASLLSGQSVQQQANQDSGAMMARQMAAMGSMFGMGGGVPQAGATQGANPQALGAALGGQPPQSAGPASPAGVLGLPGMSPAQSFISSQMFPKEYAGAYMKPYTANDTTVSAVQGGVDPVVANRLALIKSSTDPKILAMQQGGMSPDLIYKAVYGEAAKGAEIDRRGGNQFLNVLTGEHGMTPKLPENANPTGAPLPSGAIPGVVPMPGAIPIAAATAGATQGAKTDNSVFTGVPGPGGQPISGRGNTLFPHAGAPGTPEAGTTYTPENLQAQIDMVRSNGGAPINPADQPAIDREVARLSALLPNGVIAGQTTTAKSASEQAGALPQKTMEERFTSLRDANGQAETTNSYLQNIKGLAAKASVGPFADKLAYAQALAAPFLTSADAALSAKQLLDKYSNQIVARLGQGGLGTDAARTILQSAYPNSHMTEKAIADAADNLIGANGMIQAKARLLSPVYASRDPVAYQKAEQAFDQNADPRIWEYAGIADPARRKAFIQGVVKADPGFLAKAAKLHEMGAL